MKPTRISVALLFFLCSLCILPGCWQGSKKGGLVVVNVLDKELFDDCHITGSINIPLDQLEQNMDTIERDADLVFYCSNYQCTGSWYAAEKFSAHGFENVAAYEGGMAEWYQAGLPVEGKCLKAYLSKPSHKIEDEETSSIALITKEQLVQKMKEVAA